MYDNKPQKSKAPRIAGIIIIILLVIFGKGLLFNDTDDKNPEETVQVTETTTETQSFLGKLDDSAKKAESKVKEKLDDSASKVESKVKEKLDNSEDKAESKINEKKDESKEKKTTTAGKDKKTEKKSSKDKNSKKDSEPKEKVYKFRNDKLKKQHYEKHGKEMGFESADDYENAASDVANSPDALHKTEKEDGDDVYYIEDTNDFVVISGDGYIRTYFYPDSGKAYYDKQ